MLPLPLTEGTRASVGRAALYGPTSVSHTPPAVPSSAQGPSGSPGDARRGAGTPGSHHTPRLPLLPRTPPTLPRRPWPQPGPWPANGAGPSRRHSPSAVVSLQALKEMTSYLTWNKKECDCVFLSTWPKARHSTSLELKVSTCQIRGGPGD